MDKKDKLLAAYEPDAIEDKWYKYWLERNYFHAQTESDRPSFTIILPPPNITGALHMGHALTVTIQDMLIRWKRMKGYNALWFPGSDHAGIATQMVVERALQKEGKNRHEIGRDEFVKRVWNWKEKYGNRIRQQHERLGASLDWERERFTLDEKSSKAVRFAFVTLYNEGLIYRAERLINWCTSCRSAISDLEVDREEQEAGEMWNFAYTLEDGSGEIVVATTRPETMLGDTAVAVHPDDPRYKNLIGKNVRHPFQDRLIPIIGDPILADPEKGTGAVKVTPAHDPNDFESGQRNNLKIINILNIDGTLNENGYPFAGLDRFEARKQVKEKIKQMGLERGSKQHFYAPGRCYRHHDTIVEPMISTQWFVNASELAKPALEAVKNGKTDIIPDEWKKTYFNWLENIRDWCISRQLWWGHRIPAWYCRDCNEVIVSIEDVTKCTKCGSSNIIQDEDVLDTWFSSGLWPFSTLGWPEKTKELEKFYPTSILETGYDILFFWVARMMMMGMHFMKDVPFKKVLLHSIVRDEHGKKMSKATGNVIDPLDVISGISQNDLIEKVKGYNLTPKEEKKAQDEVKKNFPEGIPKLGCDALRFTLASYTAQGRDINLSLKRVEGYKRFCNKIWQLVRGIVLPNLEEFTPPLNLPVPKLLEDQWIISKLYNTIEKVENALEEFKINDATSSLYQFLWHELCDWYAEIIKPRLYGQDIESKNQAQIYLYHCLEVSFRLLHPIMPFITEELWQALPHKPSDPQSIMVTNYPDKKEAILNTQAEEKFELIQNVIIEIRAIKSDYNIAVGKKVDVLLFSEDYNEIESIKKSQELIKLLAKVEKIEYLNAPPPAKGGALAVKSKTSIYVPLKGVIDVEEEKARLKKELEKASKEFDRVNTKLQNPNFKDKAPHDIVAKEEKIFEELSLQKSKLIETIKKLEEI